MKPSIACPGRVCTIKGMHYIGPTRTPYDQDLDSVVCTQKEVDWMHSEINLVIPKLNLTRKDFHLLDEILIP